jgi:uncharacterized phage protein gp47/JayE
MLYQVDYTSRDYDSLRADLIKVIQSRIPEWSADDPSDFALALVESFAYVGDLLSYYIDRAANEANIETATQKSTLVNFAEIFGYKPSGPTPALVTLTFTNNTGSILDIPVGTQVSADLTNGPFTEAYFETLTAVSQLANGGTIEVEAIEGKTSNTDEGQLDGNNLVVPVNLGTSSGYAYTEVVIENTGIVDGSIFVYVGHNNSFTKWTYVYNIVEYGPFDKVYTTRLNSDGTTSIIFGDGINGLVPVSGDTISGTYRASVGSAGNVVANTIKSVTFIPGNSNTSGIIVSNNAAAVGGADGETLGLLRKNLKATLASRNRAVTLEDYENLASLVPGVGRVSASADVATSVNIYMQPLYDGTSTPGLVSGLPTGTWNSIAEEISSFLKDRMPINASLTVLPPTYVNLTLGLELIIQDSYRQRDVKIAVAKALFDSKFGVFSYNVYGFGATVALSQIISAIMSVPGVLQVNVDTLFRDSGSGAANVELLANEIPALASNNLTITVEGGIS